MTEIIKTKCNCGEPINVEIDSERSSRADGKRPHYDGSPSNSMQYRCVNCGDVLSDSCPEAAWGEIKEKVTPLSLQAENDGLKAQVAALTESNENWMKGYLDAKALLLKTLQHHQGANSEIGQPIRKFLGIGQFDDLPVEDKFNG